MRNPYPDWVEDLHPDEGSLNPGTERYSVNLLVKVDAEKQLWIKLIKLLRWQRHVVVYTGTNI